MGIVIVGCWILAVSIGWTIGYVGGSYLNIPLETVPDQFSWKLLRLIFWLLVQLLSFGVVCVLISSLHERMMENNIAFIVVLISPAIFGFTLGAGGMISRIGASLIQTRFG